MEKMILEIAKLAEEAGRAIMDVYERESFDVTEKDDRSPLTEADLASNRVIIEGLSLFDPPAPVLSEESTEAPYETRKKWRRYWLVDPLDGTKEFIKKNGEFTVNIALMEENRPVAGVVSAPALGVTWYAAKGLGAWRRKSGEESERIKVSPPGDEPIKIVASRSHRGSEVDGFIEKLNRPYEVISCGSSIKLCKVAEGAAHLYPRFGPTMEWDIAAAHIVVTEAGGIITGTTGESIVFNKKELLNPYFIVSAPLSFSLPR